MAKLKNPPQGGEKYLCITLFLTMILSVVSTVAIIYSVVIIYLPSKKVLESQMIGPVMCTTVSNERNIDDKTTCGGGELYRDCCPKFATGLNIRIGIVQKV